MVVSTGSTTGFSPTLILRLGKLHLSDGGFDRLNHRVFPSPLTIHLSPDKKQLVFSDQQLVGDQSPVTNHPLPLPSFFGWASFTFHLAPLTLYL
jgi:hypothetical protein